MRSALSSLVTFPGRLAILLVVSTAAWAGVGTPMGQTASEPWVAVSSVADCQARAAAKSGALYFEAVPDVMGGFQCKVYSGGIMGAPNMRKIDEGGNLRFCGTGDELSYKGKTICVTDWSRQAGTAQNVKNQTELPTTYDGLGSIHDGELRGYRLARKK